MDLDKAIKSRFSCKHFKTKTPDWKKIIHAVDAASKSPLAGNIPALKFIVVNDEEKIRELGNASTQSFVGKAKYIVVVCSDDKKLVRSYEQRGKRYSRQQAGAAIENFLLKITDLGLGSCWIGAFVDEQVKRVLHIPEEIEVEALLPVGYPMKKMNQNFKPSLDEVMFFNKWKSYDMTEVHKPEAL